MSDFVKISNVGNPFPVKVTMWCPGEPSPQIF